MIDRAVRPIKRVLVVASGHGWSTIDAFSGLMQGFRDAGYEAFNYDLHTRLDAAEGWIRFVAREFGDGEPEEVDKADILYQAGCGAVTEALRINADAVVIVCGLLFEPRLYVLLQRAGLPTFLFGTESPYDDQMMKVVATLSTVVSVNEPSSVEAVEEARADSVFHAPVLYLPLGYNAHVHKPGFGLDSNLPEHDVVFVGNIYPSREEQLGAIDWTDIDFGIYGVTPTVAQDAPIRQYIRHDGAVANPIAAGLYNKSKIVLNLFRTEQFGEDWQVVRQVQAEAVSPRLIEAAACGCCIVSEWRPQVDEVFGDSIATFRTPEEASAVIRELLADDVMRARMGAEARTRVQGYDYAERARQIISALDGAVLHDVLTVTM